MAVSTTKVLAATVPLGIIASGVLVWQASYAAFSATTTNPSNTFSAGTVTLTDDRQPRPCMFNRHRAQARQHRHRLHQGHLQRQPRRQREDVREERLTSRHSSRRPVALPDHPGRRRHRQRCRLLRLRRRRQHLQPHRLGRHHQDPRGLRHEQDDVRHRRQRLRAHRVAARRRPTRSPTGCRTTTRPRARTPPPSSPGKPRTPEPEGTSPSTSLSREPGSAYADPGSRAFRLLCRQELDRMTSRDVARVIAT